jgi:hypothetical protein
MQTGFSHEVAPRLIRRNPGRPARFYARIALKQKLAGSDALDPEFSLASTLAKEVRERRLPGIESRMVGGTFCYFPADVQKSRYPCPPTDRSAAR